MKKRKKIKLPVKYFSFDKKGIRVELVSTTDPYTNLKPGDRGSIWGIDKSGLVWVNWDKASRLVLCPELDQWIELEEK